MKEVAGDTTSPNTDANLLVVQSVCVKLLLGDKVILHPVLLVRLLGSGGIWNQRRR